MSTLAEDIEQTFAVQIANGCEELLARSDLIVARLIDGADIDSRTIEKGEVAEFVKFIVEEKQEDAEVLVWTADKLREENNWKMRYPIRMKTFYKRRSSSGRRAAAS